MLHTLLGGGGLPPQADSGSIFSSAPMCQFELASAVAEWVMILRSELFSCGRSDRPELWLWYSPDLELEWKG